MVKKGRTNVLAHAVVKGPALDGHEATLKRQANYISINFEMPISVSFRKGCAPG